MWNPFRLPFAALGIVADVARALTELPKLLEGVTARSDAVLAELERLRDLVQGLTEQVTMLRAEVQELRDQIADSVGLQSQLDQTQAELAEANRQIGRMVEAAKRAQPAATPAKPEPQPQPEAEAAPERRRGRFSSAFRRSSPA